MIRIRYENVDPVIVDWAYDYDYYIRDGVFELSYWIQEDPGQPPFCMHLHQNFGKSDRIYLELETFPVPCRSIYLELETPRWTRKYSFAESPTVLMTAMSDYETEINLETITQEIEW